MDLHAYETSFLYSAYSLRFFTKRSFDTNCRGMANVPHQPICSAARRKRLMRVSSVFAFEASFAALPDTLAFSRRQRASFSYLVFKDRVD